MAGGGIESQGSHAAHQKLIEKSVDVTHTSRKTESTSMPQSAKAPSMPQSAKTPSMPQLAKTGSGLAENPSIPQAVKSTAMPHSAPSSIPPQAPKIPSMQQINKSPSEDDSVGERESVSSDVGERESLIMEQQHVHDVYDRMAHHFADVRYKAWPRVKRFLQELEPGTLVADVGCGSGKYLHLNHDIVKLGSDRCRGLVDIARGQGHEVMVCDHLSVPYRDACLDAVISIGVLHHVTTKRRRIRALSELARVLCPGGKVMIYVWALEQESRKFESQDVLVPWHFASKDRPRKVRGKLDREISSVSSVSEDEVFEAPVRGADQKSCDHICGNSILPSSPPLHLPLGSRSQLKSAINTSLPILLRDRNHRRPNKNANGENVPFDFSPNDSAILALSPATAQPENVVKVCVNCGHDPEVGTPTSTRASSTSENDKKQTGSSRDTSPLHERIRTKFIDFFNSIKNPKLSKAKVNCVLNTPTEMGEAKNMTKPKNGTSYSLSKDARYKELIEYIMKEEASLLAAGQDTEEYPSSPDMLCGFAVREFPASSRLIAEESARTSADVPLNVTKCFESNISHNAMLGRNDPGLHGGSNHERDECDVVERQHDEGDNVECEECDNADCESDEVLQDGIQEHSTTVSPSVAGGLRRTLSMGEQLYDIASDKHLQEGMSQLNLLYDNDKNDRIPKKSQRDLQHAQCVPNGYTKADHGVSNAKYSEGCESHKLPLGPSMNDDFKAVLNQCADPEVLSQSANKIFCIKEQKNALNLQRCALNADNPASDSTPEPSVLGCIEPEKSSDTSDEVFDGCRLKSASTLDEDSDSDDWVRMTTEAIRVVQEQVRLQEAQTHHRRRSRCALSSSSTISLVAQLPDSISSDGYSTASDYDDGDSSDWQQELSEPSQDGCQPQDCNDSDFSSSNGITDDFDSQISDDVASHTAETNLPKQVEQVGESSIASGQCEKAAQESTTGSSLEVTADQAAIGAISEPTYHRYYHVFREGELDLLIQKYVPSLFITQSYYDHANWCVVAEKVKIKVADKKI